MPDSSAADTLTRLLSQELLTLEGFVSLLEREQQSLSAASGEHLVELAAEKGRVAAALGHLSSARDHELARLHLPPGRAGMDAWVLTETGRPSRKNWDRLLALAGQARAQNDANGKLISLQLSHNQQALSVLLAAANQTATYGPDGQPSSAAGGRSLGSA